MQRMPKWARTKYVYYRQQLEKAKKLHKKNLNKKSTNEFNNLNESKSRKMQRKQNAYN